MKREQRIISTTDKPIGEFHRLSAQEPSSIITRQPFGISKNLLAAEATSEYYYWYDALPHM